MRKLVFILIAIVLYSCSQEDNLTEDNITVDFTSTPCDVFNRPNALFPDNVIEIEEGDDLSLIINGLNPASGVTLYFKSGVHLVPTATLSNGNLTPYSVLDFRSFTKGVELVGDGICSEIRQVDANNACSVRLIHIYDSENIKIHNLFLNGNRDNLCVVNPGEQGNNIRIRDSEDILIRNIRSVNANGDALNIGCSDNIIVENSFFDSVNRNTLTLGWNGDNADDYVITDLCISNNIIIRNNTFSNADTQYIDFEHGDSYKGVQIINNDFLPRSIFVSTDVNDQYAIAFTNVEQHSSISNVLALNSFHRNRLTFISSENISVRFNDSIGKTRILGNVQNMIFRGNSFKIEPTQFYADDHIFNQGVLIRKINSSEETENIQFNNNEFYISNFERGIEIRNAKNIQVKNNNIVNVNTVQKPNINTNVLYGVRLMAEFNDEASAYIHGNTMTNWPDDVITISANNSSAICTGSNCD